MVARFKNAGEVLEVPVRQEPRASPVLTLTGKQTLRANLKLVEVSAQLAARSFHGV